MPLAADKYIRNTMSITYLKYYEIGLAYGWDYEPYNRNQMSPSVMEHFFGGDYQSSDSLLSRYTSQELADYANFNITYDTQFDAWDGPTDPYILASYDFGNAIFNGVKTYNLTAEDSYDVFAGWIDFAYPNGTTMSTDRFRNILLYMTDPNGKYTSYAPTPEEKDQFNSIISAAAKFATRVSNPFILDQIFTQYIPMAMVSYAAGSALASIASTATAAAPSISSMTDAAYYTEAIGANPVGSVDALSGYAQSTIDAASVESLGGVSYNVTNATLDNTGSVSDILSQPADVTYSDLLSMADSTPVANTPEAQAVYEMTGSAAAADAASTGGDLLSTLESYAGTALTVAGAAKQLYNTVSDMASDKASKNSGTKTSSIISSLLPFFIVGGMAILIRR